MNKGYFLKRMNKGFTLVELLVSISIMIIMTTILVSKYPESTVKTILANSTQSFSLLVRETQIRGSAVDSLNNSLGGYGIFLTRATSSDLVFFGDIIDPLIEKPQGLSVGNGLYDATPVDEMKTIKKLNKGYSYKKLCVASTTAPKLIAPHGFVCNENNMPPIETLTISFIRPSQVAHLYINGSSDNEFTAACVQLYSPKSPDVGHIRSVKVYHSGMVISGANSCD